MTADFSPLRSSSSPPWRCSPPTRCPGEWVVPCRSCSGGRPPSSGRPPCWASCYPEEAAARRSCSSRSDGSRHWPGRSRGCSNNRRKIAWPFNMEMYNNLSFMSCNVCHYLTPGGNFNSKSISQNKIIPWEYNQYRKPGHWKDGLPGSYLTSGSWVVYRCSHAVIAKRSQGGILVTLQCNVGPCETSLLWLHLTSHPVLQVTSLENEEKRYVKCQHFFSLSLPRLEDKPSERFSRNASLTL